MRPSNRDQLEIDINCDMGESFGAWILGCDEVIMPYVSSANIACGAHAGDPNVMERTVLLAKRHGVAVGAHPGYPDMAGFGRRALSMDMDDLRRTVLAQLGALYAIARSVGVELRHVKAHGALYNGAAQSPREAVAFAQAVARFSKSLKVFCPPHSEMEKAVREMGLETVAEGFADRVYEPTGLLAQRSETGALLADPELAVKQAVQLVNGRVTARDGSLLDLRVRTICVHGDNPQAAVILPAIRSALEAQGWTICSAGND